MALPGRRTRGGHTLTSCGSVALIFRREPPAAPSGPSTGPRQWAHARRTRSRRSKSFLYFIKCPRKLGLAPGPQRVTALSRNLDGQAAAGRASGRGSAGTGAEEAPFEAAGPQWRVRELPSRVRHRPWQSRADAAQGTKVVRTGARSTSGPSPDRRDCRNRCLTVGPCATNT